MLSERGTVQHGPRMWATTVRPTCLLLLDAKCEERRVTCTSKAAKLRLSAVLFASSPHLHCPIGLVVVVSRRPAEGWLNDLS